MLCDESVGSCSPPFSLCMDGSKGKVDEIKEEKTVQRKKRDKLDKVMFVSTVIIISFHIISLANPMGA